MKISQVKGAETDQAPALTLGAATPKVIPIYLAWKEAGKETIVYSHSTDGGASWAKPVPIQGPGSSPKWVAETDLGPSLTLGADGNLYAAWKGKGKGTAKGADQIWYSTSPDGVTWKDQETIPHASTTSAPSLTANSADGPVAVAWRTPTDTINWTTFPFGVVTWGGIFEIPPGAETETDQAPALASTGFSGPGLIVAWKQKGLEKGKKENTLWYGSIVPTTSPFKATKLAGAGFIAASSMGPALPSITYSSAPLAMVWSGSDTEIWGSADFPNAPLTQQRIGGRPTDVLTKFAPAYLGLGSLMAFTMASPDPTVAGTLWTCTPF
jgi:hypothetical protein